MKIYGDVISPFVRACLVTAEEVGLGGKFEYIKLGVNPTQEQPLLAKLSPIAKIPVLETDHHHAIYDSRVIIEYLAHVAGNRSLIPDDGVKRFRVLTLQALAAGMADAAVALRYEQAQRPAGTQWPQLIDRHVQRIRAGIADVEANWRRDLEDVTAATVMLATTLSYIDLRHGALNWRDGTQVSADFHVRFSARASMKKWDLPAA